MTATLNAAQREVVTFYNGYGVPVTWFVGPERDDDSVEVIGLGENFVWSLLIQQDGEYASSECALDPEGFSTGIEI